MNYIMQLFLVQVVDKILFFQLFIVTFLKFHLCWLYLVGLYVNAVMCYTA